MTLNIVHCHSALNIEIEANAPRINTIISEDTRISNHPSRS